MMGYSIEYPLSLLTWFAPVGMQEVGEKEEDEYSVEEQDHADAHNL